MNLRVFLFLFSVSGTLISGCISKQLGYFEVNPYAQVNSNKIDQPLYVKLSDRIEDHFEIKDPGVALKVNDFHKSLYYAFNRSFKDLFLDVQPVMPQSTGFILEVQRMEPRWEVKERKKTNYNTTAPENDLWCVLEYASSIYRSELLVSQSTGAVRIKLGDSNIYTVDALFKEAVKQACAKMTQDHYDKR